MSPRWTKQEHYKVLRLCERHTLQEMSRIIGRTPVALHNHLHKHGLRPYCATVSLAAASRNTGYDWSQLVRARDALQQRWLKVGASLSSRYRITEDQLEALCEYLKTEPSERSRGRTFWKYVEKCPDGHWRWHSTKLMYIEQVDYVQKSYRPARFAWILAHPDEELGTRSVFRSCNEPLCVNPDHHYCSRTKRPSNDSPPS